MENRAATSLSPLRGILSPTQLHEASAFLQNWCQNLGGDPFAELTWLSNGYCTFHNRKKCRQCRDGYGKKYPGNTCRVGYQPEPPAQYIPAADSWTYFHRAYTAGPVGMPTTAVTDATRALAFLAAPARAPRGVQYPQAAAYLRPVPPPIANPRPQYNYQMHVNQRLTPPTPSQFHPTVQPQQQPGSAPPAPTASPAGQPDYSSLKWDVPIGTVDAHLQLANISEPLNRIRTDVPYIFPRNWPLIRLRIGRQQDWATFHVPNMPARDLLSSCCKAQEGKKLVRIEGPEGAEKRRDLTPAELGTVMEHLVDNLGGNGHLSLEVTD